MFTVSAYPSNGSPGDLIQVTFPRGEVDSDAKVTIGSERLLVVASTDSSLTVMVPPLDPQETKLTVLSGTKNASTDFRINQHSTVRLWFTMNNNEVKFIKSQSSNESFVQNNSFSDNRLMYEITDKSGENIVTGYINNPIILEVPAVDKKGLSIIERKGPITFSINVPALKEMTAIRFFAINQSTNYKPKALTDSLINVDLK